MKMRLALKPAIFGATVALAVFAAPVRLYAQQPDGPQLSAPSASAPPSQPGPAAPGTPTPQPAKTLPNVVVPAGTRLGVMLENGISTRSAKPGDSVYLRTTFPITENNVGPLLSSITIGFAPMWS